MSLSHIHRPIAKYLLWITHGHCYYCGSELDEWNWSLDHVTPEILGGTHNPANFVPCCRVCNSIKSKRSYNTFKKDLWLYHGCEEFTQRQINFLKKFHRINVLPSYEARFWGDGVKLQLPLIQHYNEKEFGPCPLISRAFTS